jgi:mono/diheme cytochrome c family protein
MNKQLMWGLVSLLAVLAPLHLTAAEEEATGDAKRGKQLFAENGCWKCHGYNAQGGGIFGPRIGPNFRPWPLVKMYVRAPAGDMPPFSEKVLPDKDLFDIWTYFNTVPGPRPVEKITALKD